MALKDLKTDLSKVNIPFNKKPISQEISKGNIPNIPNPNELGVSNNLTKLNKNQASFKSKTILELFNDFAQKSNGLFQQMDNKSGQSISIFNNIDNNRLNNIAQISNDSLIFGRNFNTPNINNNIITKTKIGLNVSDNTILINKEGIDVSNNINIKNKIGKDITNNSLISGRNFNTPIIDNFINVLNKTGVNVSNNINVIKKEGITIQNNQSVIDWNKQSIFNEGLNKPTGMIARLFTSNDTNLRNNVLKLNEGFKTTLIKSDSILYQQVDSQYNVNKTSNIDGILVTSKPGYTDLPNGGESGLPYIRRKIGQTWYSNSMNASPSFNNVEFVSGGLTTQLNRIKADEERITKFLISPIGIQWLAMQQGAQLMNPKVDGIGPLRWNRIYNPLSIPAAIAGWSIGYHPERHGLFGLTPDYEEIVKLKNRPELNISISPIMGNRILQLWRETGRGLDTLVSLGINNATRGLPLLTLSGICGPNSLYGIGATIIRKSTSGRDFNVADLMELQINKKINKNLITINPTQLLPAIIYDYNKQYSTVILINSNILSIFRGALQSNTFQGYKINAHYLNPDFDDTSLYAKSYRYNPDADINILSDLKQSKKVGSQTKGISGIEENKSQIIKDYNQYSKNPTWNPGTILDSRVQNAFPPYIDSEEAKIYNTLKYIDLDNENKVSQIKNTRKYKRGELIYDAKGNIQRGSNTIKVESPKWSKVRDYYKKKYGDKAFESMTDPNGPYMPDTGYPDPVYVEDGLTPIVTNDFITFLICNTQFRAILKSLSYAFSPSWNEVKYVGRPDSVGIYSGLTRDVNFSFIAAAISEDEMGIIYKHLNELGQKVSPLIIDNKMVAPIYTLTIGNFIKNEFGYLTSLNFNIDNEYPWDIQNYKLPMYVDVDCSFRVIGKQSPSRTTLYIGDPKFIPPESSSLTTNYLGKENPGNDVGGNVITGSI